MRETETKLLVLLARNAQTELHDEYCMHGCCDDCKEIMEYITTIVYVEKEK